MVDPYVAVVPNAVTTKRKKINHGICMASGQVDCGWGWGWRRFEVGEDKPGRGGLAGLVHAGKHEANLSGASTGVKCQASGVRREAVVKVNAIPEPHQSVKASRHGKTKIGLVTWSQ
ncbi:hypothetical protein E5D57_004939 [Metarhizium anisopliae]|nr:hypothetical protein E5D57_004939 [Metarhizium anisopliae]